MSCVKLVKLGYHAAPVKHPLSIIHKPPHNFSFLPLDIPHAPPTSKPDKGGVLHKL